MSVLPSPVPHPLEFSPFDVPSWAYEALEWVVGFDWPAGNEVTTWDVADRWYSLVTTLTAPSEAAMAGANKFLAGFGGEGITAEGFENAWHLVAGDEDAPLHGLIRASDQLGKLVEGCGADIEAAKLEAWIEIGIFLIELVGMAVTVALTLGAASPAAGGLIAATRLAIQQIFKRLAEQLGKKALKQTAGRAVKQLTTREGLRHLGHEAAKEGFDEAREEFATNGGIQLYQQSTGRSDGFDLDNLGRSALAGFAGGAAASGAHAGSHGHGGIARGAGGEVLAEFSAAATFGQLPDAAGLAKSATSGATGSAMHGMHAPIDIGHLDALPQFPDLSSRTPEGAGPPTTMSPDLASLDVSPTPSQPNLERVTDPSSPTSPPPPSPSLDAPSSPQQTPSSPTLSPVSSPSPSSPTPSTSSSTSPQTPPPSPTTPSPTTPSPTTPPSPAAPSPSVSALAAPPLSTPTPSLPDGSNVLASTATLGFADPLTTPSPTSAPTVSPPSPSPSPSSPVFGSFLPPPAGLLNRGAPGSPTPTAKRIPVSDLDRIAEALGPRPAPSRRRPLDAALPPSLDGATSRPSPHRDPFPRQDRSSRNPSPPNPSWRNPSPPHHRPAPVAPEIRDEQAYFGYVDHSRQTLERNRRDEYTAYLDRITEDNRARILDLGRQADIADRNGATLEARHHRRQAFELSEINTELDTQIAQIHSGDLAPDRVEIDPPDWARVNQDVGNLAPGGVRTGDLSALDGLAGRPSIDRTRHYNVTGGLRPPLAVHQVDLENAMPRDAQGNVSRLADPREGGWFRLANDGGPAADPTRGLNCVDGVLSLFDTYTHARPRVSAPRTFDVYANGNPDRPLGGETNGINRIRQATGGDFQSLSPYVGDAAPAQAKPAIDQAITNLTNHLLNTGHGAFAFIVTDLEGGGSHSWAAVNQHGTVLYLDPQIGRISEHHPMYTHHGVATPVNITSVEALVVDANATPAPLPNHGPGAWSATPPTGTDHGASPAFTSLTPDQQARILASTSDARRIALSSSRDLHAVVRSLDHNPARALDHSQARVVDEEHRVKSAESLSRKFLEASELEGVGLDEFVDRAKDRVRFSVETPEESYASTVTQVLAGLRELGYRTTSAADFWADHGRHNGLNVWLTTPEGFKVEIQFPTPLSRALGKETHESYEIVRLGHAPAYRRVNAFLDILAINKRYDVYARRPAELPSIGALKKKVTTLASWFASEPGTLAQYKKDLRRRGISFESDLRQHGLDAQDVPGTEGMGLLE
ncbi:hypothetical protein KOI35_08520 [Actinoplanes bogorensis]|uniref:Tox-PL domain-containing protein n=1 Tax=Paractinoplanes bogorensis TaxID=1610840 RepID=A0ABS5YJH7_9ACTN|nr:toxin glutamine deamidase domain-containing protein [Actinoplanes bogorensis]MBU2663547.1 hypothetical protein [Actinoplanes bogorensis]